MNNCVCETIININKSIMSNFMNRTINFAEKNQLTLDNYNNFIPSSTCEECQKLIETICCVYSGEIFMYLNNLPDKSENNIQTVIQEYCNLTNRPDYMIDMFYNIFMDMSN